VNRRSISIGLPVCDFALLDVPSGAFKIACMNLEQTHYSAFGLVRDMLATADVIANFDADQATDTAKRIAPVGKLHLTGEGSSRIFPAKHAMMQARRAGWRLALHTDAGRQSQEYDLRDWAVFAASNSGRRRKSSIVQRPQGERVTTSLRPDRDDGNSKLGELSNQCYVLKCGPKAPSPRRRA
jgi:glucosamine--fructose-6-phosphate aminotransferase (isomerizing)